MLALESVKPGDLFGSGQLRLCLLGQLNQEIGEAGVGRVEFAGSLKLYQRVLTDRLEHPVARLAGDFLRLLATGSCR